jgi:sarcosine oxidase, subunit gamma
MDPSLASRLSFSVPGTFNTVAEDAERTTLWLGPDEWLVVAAPGAGDAIAGELEESLAGAHHSIVDVSANRAVLELSGGRSKDLLSKGCPIDLHPTRWRPGMCAQTVIAKAQVLLHEREASTRVFVRPSFGDYLVEWLIDAAQEYRSA